MSDHAATNDGKLRCQISGQHRLLVECLRLLLEPGFEVRSTGANLDEALALARTFAPHVAIIDWPSPRAALDLAKRLQAERPGLALTLLSDEEHPQWSAEALSKSCSAAELMQRLRARTAAVSIPSCRSDAPDSVADNDQVLAGVKLSRRELQVLVLLVRGLRMKEVARLLGIAPRTVAFHKYRAMDNNRLHSQADLLDFALRHGLFSGDFPKQFEPVLSPVMRGAADTCLYTSEPVTSFGRDRR